MWGICYMDYNEIMYTISDLIKKEKDLFGSNYIEQSYKDCGDIVGNYELTEEESLVIQMMISNGANLIQGHLYGGISANELEQELTELIDKALLKIPTEKDSPVVYRCDDNPIITANEVNRIVSYPAYLTASLVRLPTSCSTLYVIELAKDSQARSLYKVKEINPCVQEWQVLFPKGTRFEVKSHQTIHGKTVIMMQEL